MFALWDADQLRQAEALRQHIAAQIPGQIDIWDAVAEVEAETRLAAVRATWPAPAGVLWDAPELRGQLAIA